MFEYLWPLALIVISNIAYQICAKEVPHSMDPLASFTITYTVGAITSFVLYFVIGKHHNLLKEYSHTNWAPFLLGVVIVGLEVGFIYAYKNGWQVSTLSTIMSLILAIALVFVGFLVYNETISSTKIIGILICIVGLYFINK